MFPANSVFKGSGGGFNRGSEIFPDAQYKPADSPLYLFERMTILTLFVHTTDHD